MKKVSLSEKDLQRIVKRTIKEHDYSNREQVKDKIVDNIIGEIISMLEHSDQMGLDDKIGHSDLHDILTRVYEETEFLFMNNNTNLY